MNRRADLPRSVEKGLAPTGNPSMFRASFKL